MSSFAPLIGQPHAIELLTCAVERDRIAPAYLFAGAPGVGRSLAAKCFAELLLSHDPAHPPTGIQQRIQKGNHPDLLWVEPTYLHQGKRIAAAEAEELGLKRKSPPLIRLDQIREIAQFLARPSLEAPRSVVVLEQAETMSEAPANGLLKTLEEPGHATLILIAPSIESLLPTLVSRCQRIAFRRLNTTEMTQVLERAGHTDVLQHLEVLALAQGSPGAAIAHWQQLQAIPAELLEATEQPPRSLRQALELARDIDKTLDTEEQLWLVNYLQHRYWQTFPQPSLLRHLETARRHLLSYVQPRLVWEVTLMAMAQ
jgi:DNA polymerase III subunit delta'